MGARCQTDPVSGRKISSRDGNGRTTSACILCGHRPLTRAHFFGSVLRDEFPGQTESAIVFTQPVAAHESITQRYRMGVAPVNASSRLLCQTCNGDWMSPMEEAALPTIVKMTRGENVTFDRPHLEQLSSWALAVTILRARVDEGLRPVDSEAARRFRNEGLSSQRLVTLFLHVARDFTYGNPGGVMSQVFHDVDLDRGGLVAVYWLRSLVIVVALEDHANWIGRSFALAESALVGYPPGRAETFSWPPAASLAEKDVGTRLGYDELMTSGELTNTYTGPGRDIMITARHGDHVHSSGLVLLPDHAPRPEQRHFSRPQEFPPIESTPLDPGAT